MSVNRVTLIGNLGADPELKYLPSNNTAVCNLRLATTEVWKDRDGRKKEETEWHRVVCYGQTAENVNKYMAKGSSLYIEGRIKTRSWEDKDGQKRYSTEVVAERVKFLGGGGKREGGGGGGGDRWRSDGGGGPTDDMAGMPAGGDDGIPF